MFRIEKTNYGVKLTLRGTITGKEMTDCANEIKTMLPNLGTEFGVFTDMRTLAPLDKKAKKILEDTQDLFKQKGLTRSVVILSTTAQKTQVKQMAQESGVYEWERYIDSDSDTNWKNTGEEWIINAVDPDRTPIPV